MGDRSDLKFAIHGLVSEMVRKAYRRGYSMTFIADNAKIPARMLRRFMADGVWTIETAEAIVRSFGRELEVRLVGDSWPAHPERSRRLPTWFVWCPERDEFGPNDGLEVEAETIEEAIAEWAEMADGRTDFQPEIAGGECDEPIVHVRGPDGRVRRWIVRGRLEAVYDAEFAGDETIPAGEDACAPTK